MSPHDKINNVRIIHLVLRLNAVFHISWFINVSLFCSKNLFHSGLAFTKY